MIILYYTSLLHILPIIIKVLFQLPTDAVSEAILTSIDFLHNYLIWHFTVYFYFKLKYVVVGPLRFHSKNMIAGIYASFLVLQDQST